MTVTEAYYDKHYFDAGGTTGNTYYYRLIRRGDGSVWDASTGKMELAPTWPGSAIAMTERPANTGQYPIRIPAGIPKGHIYEAVIYLQAGSQPINTDNVVGQYELKIGDIFGF